jgi:hypothetical protein
VQPSAEVLAADPDAPSLVIGFGILDSNASAIQVYEMMIIGFRI